MDKIPEPTHPKTLMSRTSDGNDNGDSGFGSLSSNHCTPESTPPSSPDQKIPDEIKEAQRLYLSNFVRAIYFINIKIKLFLSKETLSISYFRFLQHSYYR